MLISVSSSWSQLLFLEMGVAFLMSIFYCFLKWVWLFNGYLLFLVMGVAF